MSFVNIGPAVRHKNKKSHGGTGARSSSVTVPASWPAQRAICRDQQHRLELDAATAAWECNSPGCQLRGVEAGGQPNRNSHGVRQAVTPVNFVWAGPLLDIAFLPRPPHPHEAAWYTSQAPQGAFLLRGQCRGPTTLSECWKD